MSDPALIGPADNAALTAYKGPTDVGAGVSFGRQLATGGSARLPPGSVEEGVPSLGCAARRLRIPVPIGTDGTEVFYFQAAKDSSVTRIQIALHISPVTGKTISLFQVWQTQ